MTWLEERIPQLLLWREEAQEGERVARSSSVVVEVRGLASGSGSSSTGRRGARLVGGIGHKRRLLVAD